MAHALLEHLVQQPHSEHTQRRAAEMLALGQPRARVRGWLEASLPDPRAIRMIGYLAHTLVIQGWRADDTELSLRLQQALEAARHPLAALPLSLTDLELNLPLPQYGYVLGKFGGESRPGVTTPVVTPDMALPSRDEAWPAFQRADDEVVVEALGAPFHLWQQESNASLETRAFRLDAPLSRLDASLVGRLPVASVASPATTRVATSSGREVFVELFAAGLSGGAYGGAVYAATARWLAWRAMGGLTGVSINEGREAVLAAVNDSRFYWYYDPESRFYEEVFDFAAACLRPGGRTLVLLAASDTD
ncbi:DUF6183 family protein (plasmid) [Deinococcus taeanensis]|uniref:DUF6183 family protein n=1 Tax=Deinococcus taeanensis TaxID=2737050 RepID=UPI001CDC1299|nr:DUF6183 family protein [Deinococcus taeanensis]UBV44102.1 DUF6183 family protein [Deinococcus taeanensis]